MLETINSIAVNYWVEVVFGLIAAGGGFLIKRYLRLEKENRKEEQEKYFRQLAKEMQNDNLKMIKNLQAEHDAMNKHTEEVYKESKKDDALLEKQIEVIDNKLQNLTKGILSIQRKEFLAECRKLLAEDHIITLEEWEELDSDHDAYNGLGGNHNGDKLYALAKKKFESGLIDDQHH